MMLPWIPPYLEGISQFPSSQQIPKAASQQDQSSAQTAKLSFVGHEATPAKLQQRNWGDNTKEMMENGSLQSCPTEITSSKPKPPNFPKKKRGKNTLQYCRGFSSLPEESVEARGSPWLHGKLGGCKKVFLEKQEKRSTWVISALLVHTAPVPVPNQKAPISKVT